MPKLATLPVDVTYTTDAELSGWLGNLTTDISNGSVSGFNISTRIVGQDKKIQGQVTVVIPQSHLSITVEDPE